MGLLAQHIKLQMPKFSREGREKMREKFYAKNESRWKEVLKFLANPWKPLKRDQICPQFGNKNKSIPAYYAGETAAQRKERLKK